ncbi:MAG: DUF2066 domain-containing protein [Pseudomonadales bacterium]
MRDALNRFSSLRWLALVMLVGLPLLAPAGRADGGAWLYEVQVPVADQSARARLQSAAEGLSQVLTRLTGLTELPGSEPLQRALAAPDLYYNEFAFAPDGDGGLLLQLQFVPNAVLDLMRQANLPVWGANRPSALAWVVLDDGVERHILGSGSDHPSIEALRQRARERGLLLQLPLLDLADQLAVVPAAVWGRLSQPLLEASQRYGTDLLLVGRMERRPDGGLIGDWEVWLGGDVRQYRHDDLEPAAAGVAAADLVADELAARYAVLDGGTRILNLNISAVGSAADYADLLRYLSTLEFVDDVSVVSVSGDRLGVRLTTAADAAQVQELFRLDRRLVADRLSMSIGPALDLVWQGR